MTELYHERKHLAEKNNAKRKKAKGEEHGRSDSSREVEGRLSGMREDDRLGRYGERRGKKGSGAS